LDRSERLDIRAPSSRDLKNNLCRQAQIHRSKALPSPQSPPYDILCDEVVPGRGALRVPRLSAHKNQPGQEKFQLASTLVIFLSATILRYCRFVYGEKWRGDRLFIEPEAIEEKPCKNSIAKMD